MSEQIMRQNLFVVAQAYAHATGLSLSTVSKKVHGNGDFFAGFLAGKLSCGLNTYFQMAEKFRELWKDLPTKTKWPETAKIPKLARVPYRQPMAPARKRLAPTRGKAGRFLGTNVPKGRRAR